jgi:2'-5' RNA ligase
MTIRTFIAVDIGPLDGFVKFEEELQASGAELKLVEPDNIHITLKFLGDTSEELVSGINTKISEAAENVNPFKLQFKGAGAFPNMNYMKVLWVGIFNPGPLPNLANELDQALKKFGFKSEKRQFRPHITMGRVKSKKNKDALKRVILNNKDREFGELMITKIKLKKSVLDSKGPTYYTLGEITLS